MLASTKVRTIRQDAKAWVFVLVSILLALLAPVVYVGGPQLLGKPQTLAPEEAKKLETQFQAWSDKDDGQKIVAETTKRLIFLNDPMLLRWRAIGLMKMGKSQLALRDLDKSFQLQPQPLTLLWRGKANVLLGKYKEAIDDLTKVAGALPQNPEVYYFRGIACSGLDQSQQAYNDFTRVIKMVPDFGAAYEARASVLYSVKDYRNSMKDVQKALDLGWKVSPDLIKGLNVMMGN